MRPFSAKTFGLTYRSKRAQYVIRKAKNKMAIMVMPSHALSATIQDRNVTKLISLGATPKVINGRMIRKRRVRSLN